MTRNPVARATPVLIALTVLTVLSGCSMTGLDASDHFACKAPTGVACESMSGVYANLQAGNLPSQQAGKPGTSASTAKTAAAGTATLSRPLFSGTPIRSAPRLLRLWFAPWKDDDGDLYDQSYAYLVIDSGHWLIAHNQRRIRDVYKPSPIVTGDSDASDRAPVAQPASSWSVPPRPVSAAPLSNVTPASPASAPPLPSVSPATVPPLSSDMPGDVTSQATSPVDGAVRQPALNDAAMRQFASGVRLPDGTLVEARP